MLDTADKGTSPSPSSDLINDELSSLSSHHLFDSKIDSIQDRSARLKYPNINQVFLLTHTDFRSSVLDMFSKLPSYK